MKAINLGWDDGFERALKGMRDGFTFELADPPVPGLATQIRIRGGRLQIRYRGAQRWAPWHEWSAVGPAMLLARWRCTAHKQATREQTWGSLAAART